MTLLSICILLSALSPGAAGREQHRMVSIFVRQGAFDAALGVEQQLEPLDAALEPFASLELLDLAAPSLEPLDFVARRAFRLWIARRAGEGPLEPFTALEPFEPEVVRRVGVAGLELLL